MTSRQRFLATADFTPVDRAFLLPPWLWTATLDRWRQEGLPAGVDLCDYFGTDREMSAPLAMQGPYGPHLVPPLERTVLEETAEHRIVRDEEGNTVKLFRDDAGRSMPLWLEYPVTSRLDWETIAKPRLDAAAPGRGPQGAELDAWADSVRERDLPLGLWCGSFYGWPRSLCGVERLSVWFYDEPRLVHEMCEHILEFCLAAITPLLERVEFDFAYYWEDMGCASGPLCSPAIYREFMLPRLKVLAEHLRRHGVRHIIVDSDGNNDPLIPLWLEAGVNGLRPFEVASRSDPVAVRKRYPELVIQGGIDKRALAKVPEAIRREVLSKVPWLCLQGGYFPQIDHLVPPDVSLDNYRYCAELVREVVADPERATGDRAPAPSPPGLSLCHCYCGGGGDTDSGDMVCHWRLVRQCPARPQRP